VRSSPNNVTPAGIERNTIVGLTVGSGPQGGVRHSTVDVISDGEGQCKRVGVVSKLGLGETPVLSESGGQVTLMTIGLGGRNSGRGGSSKEGGVVLNS
jgi:hypothetical protein